MKLNGRNLILFIIVALFFVIPFLFSGCAKSGVGAGGSSSGSTGSISLNINWPATKSGSKYIPSNTSSITISLTGEGLSSASTYSYASTQTTITITNIPVGSKTANISCKDSDSNILSNRIASFTVEAGKTTTVSANLGVTITDTGFTPQDITVTPGTTLLFVNSGSQAHILTGTSPFTSVGFQPGDQQSLTFSTSGTYSYYDANNVSLTGSVIAGGYSSVNKIVCTYRSVGAANPQVMTIDPANNYQKTVLTSGSFKMGPSFSWDGAKITFVDSGAAKIQIISGTNYSQESTTGQAGSFPCFNPAGTKIIYSLVAWPVGDIYQMDTNGGNVTNLTNDSAKGNDHPSITYDGTKIAYMELTTGKIYTMNSDGTGKKAITSPPGGKTDYDPAISQDGTWIVFNRYTDATHQSICVISATAAEGPTNTAIVLTDLTGCENGYPVFNPDGTKVVFASTRSGLRNLYTVNFSGTGTTKESGLTNITNATGTEDFYEADWK